MGFPVFMTGAPAIKGVQMKYEIEVISVMPPGVNHGYFSLWKRTINAPTVDEALSQYGQQMASDLPSGKTFTVKITDENGLSEEAIL